MVRTPLAAFHSDEDVSGILLKPEVLQPIGSFKVRGAICWAACLIAEERGKTVSILSGGNIGAHRLMAIPADGDRDLRDAAQDKARER